MIDLATWGWPQITMVCLTFVGIGLALANHGEPRDPQNFFTHMIAVAITYTMLLSGGFFQ